jgi:hypothetical protein
VTCQCAANDQGCELRAKRAECEPTTHNRWFISKEKDPGMRNTDDRLRVYGMQGPKLLCFDLGQAFAGFTPPPHPRKTAQERNSAAHSPQPGSKKTLLPPLLSAPRSSSDIIAGIHRISFWCVQNDAAGWTLACWMQAITRWQEGVEFAC